MASSGAAAANSRKVDGSGTALYVNVNESPVCDKENNPGSFTMRSGKNARLLSLKWINSNFAPGKRVLKKCESKLT
jgi:hypothetical protein